VWRTSARAGLVLTTTGLLAGCGLLDGSGDGRVTIEFFQFKPEAIAAFDAVIADFEAEHPDIRVVQNHVPDAETAIRTRLVKNDVPDVMTLNGNLTFGELASAEVLYDFSAEPVLDDVTPAVVDILRDLGTSSPGAVNGVPFALNANGVIYNKDLFDEHGVDPPETWADMTQALETFQRADVLPVYATLQDAWTSLPAWNTLASNAAPPDLFDQLRAESTLFADHPQVPERLAQLFEYAQADRFSRNYDAGNHAFANGEAAMYLQGSWAIPAIRTFEPEFEIGTFALPGDDASETLLVSGVDILITMGAEPSHPDETMAFVEYLMRPDVVAAYAADQSAITPLEDTESGDDALAELMPYFEEGRVTGFPDHQVPPAIPLDAINQQYLIDGDLDRYLTTLDDEWSKVQARRS
jgi:raffinose/stachyose/melibiose transport system substrate-binding protein